MRPWSNCVQCIILNCIMSISHLRSVDLNLLVALLALLEERSVGRAAIRLGLTQSATSRALARLREQFGDALLIRTSRGMIPTPRAQTLASRLPAALEALANLTQHDAGFDPAQAERVFRIATVDYCVAVVLPGLLARISERAPCIGFEVTSPGNQLNEQLESGELDLFIGPKRPSFNGVVWKRLFQDKFVTMVRKGHPRVGRTLTLGQFAELGHVVVSPEHRVGQSAIDRELSRRKLARRIAVRVPSFLIAPLVVSQSDLVSTAPERLVARFCDALPIRLLKTPLPLGTLSMSMAWHERMRREPGHQWLRDTIQST